MEDGVCNEARTSLPDGIDQVFLGGDERDRPLGKRLAQLEDRLVGNGLRVNADLGPDRQSLAKINPKLVGTERSQLDIDGVAGRPCFMSFQFESSCLLACKK